MTGMTETTQLDLTQIEWPMCLLEFSRVLDETAAGVKIRVLVSDPDVLLNVKTITVNFCNRIVSIEHEEERFILSIEKC